MNKKLLIGMSLLAILALSGCKSSDSTKESNQSFRSVLATSDSSSKELTDKEKDDIRLTLSNIEGASNISHWNIDEDHNGDKSIFAYVYASSKDFTDNPRYQKGESFYQTFIELDKIAEEEGLYATLATYDSQLIFHSYEDSKGNRTYSDFRQIPGSPLLENTVRMDIVQDEVTSLNQIYQGDILFTLEDDTGSGTLDVTVTGDDLYNGFNNKDPKVLDRLYNIVNDLNDKIDKYYNGPISLSIRNQPDVLIIWNGIYIPQGEQYREYDNRTDDLGELSE